MASIGAVDAREAAMCPLRQAGAQRRVDASRAGPWRRRAKGPVVSALPDDAGTASPFQAGRETQSGSMTAPVRGGAASKARQAAMIEVVVARNAKESYRNLTIKNASKLSKAQRAEYGFADYWEPKE
jgi:hypothetical protein